MSEKFWIIIVVAVAVVLVVFMLRRQLKSLVLKGVGMEAQVETHDTGSGATNDTSGGRRAGVSIRDFKQSGSRNELNIARDDVNVERTQQKGMDQKINVKPDEPEQK